MCSSGFIKEGVWVIRRVTKGIKVSLENKKLRSKRRLIDAKCTDLQSRDLQSRDLQKVPS